MVLTPCHYSTSPEGYVIMGGTGQVTPFITSGEWQAAAGHLCWMLWARFATWRRCRRRRHSHSPRTSGSRADLSPQGGLVRSATARDILVASFRHTRPHGDRLGHALVPPVRSRLDARGKQGAPAAFRRGTASEGRRLRLRDPPPPRADVSRERAYASQFQAAVDCCRFPEQSLAPRPEQLRHHVVAL